MEISCFDYASFFKGPSHMQQPHASPRSMLISIMDQFVNREHFMHNTFMSFGFRNYRQRKKNFLENKICETSSFFVARSNVSRSLHGNLIRSSLNSHSTHQKNKSLSSNMNQRFSSYINHPGNEIKLLSASIIPFSANQFAV